MPDEALILHAMIAPAATGEWSTCVPFIKAKVATTLSLTCSFPFPLLQFNPTTSSHAILHAPARGTTRIEIA
jgi:hypothetical protein